MDIYVIERDPTDYQLHPQELKMQGMQIISPI